MKKYDEIQKKYVTPEEYERTRKLKTRELCRGQKPHDYVLVLPKYVTYDETYKYNPEDFYKLQDEMNEYHKVVQQKIRELGVVDRSYYSSRTSRYYLCSVCKKEHIEWKE